MLTLPQLPYPLDALEPFCDARALEIHHSKHHQTYIDKANVALTELGSPDIDPLAIFTNITEYSGAVRNNVGGHWNHTFFWESMSAPQEIPTQLKDKLTGEFGSMEEFKKKFADTAMSVFGSGWVWLILTPENKLAITQTAGQDNPLMSDQTLTGTPLLVIDVWEHAYYLQYQNRRAEWIENFWNIVNWNKILERIDNQT